MPLAKVGAFANPHCTWGRGTWSHRVMCKTTQKVSSQAGFGSEWSESRVQAFTYLVSWPSPYKCLQNDWPDPIIFLASFCFCRAERHGSCMCQGQEPDGLPTDGLRKAVETGFPPAGCRCVLTFGGWLCAPGVNTLISYLAKQGFKTTLRTLMYFSTGVTGWMRNRSGSSILGFGVGGPSSPSSNCNITPEMGSVRLRLVGAFSASCPENAPHGS